MSKKKKNKKPNVRSQKTRLQKQKRRETKVKRRVSQQPIGGSVGDEQLPTELNPADAEKFFASLNPELAAELKAMEPDEDDAPGTEGRSAKPKKKRARGRPRKSRRHPAAPPMLHDMLPNHEGAFHPSLYASKRFHSFNRHLQRVIAEVGKDRKSFGFEDLKSREARVFLYRIAQRRDNKELYPWQETLLTRAGFDWKRPPRNRAVEDWMAKYEKVKALPRLENGEPDFSGKGMQPLENWFDRQVDRARKWRLSKERRDLLLAVGANFERVSIMGRRWDEKYELYRKLRSGEVKKESLKPREIGAVKRWATQQCIARRDNTIPKERIAKLDEIGFDWTPPARRSMSDEERLAAIAKVAKTKDGYDFSLVSRPGQKAFIARLRSDFRKGQLDAKLEKQIKKINLPLEGKMSENAMLGRWREHLDTFQSLLEKYGEKLTVEKMAKAGIASWVNRMRQKYDEGKLNKDWVAEMETAGFNFKYRNPRIQKWEENFKKLVAFKKEFGHLNVESSDPEYGHLVSWINSQRSKMRYGAMGKDAEKRLRDLGFTGEKIAKSERVTRFHGTYNELKAYLANNHGGKLPDSPIENERLLIWVRNQQRAHSKKRLPASKYELLEPLGLFTKEAMSALRKVKSEREKDLEQLEALKQFVKENGHPYVTSMTATRPLHRFCLRVRQRRSKGALEPELAKALESLNFEFDPNEVPTGPWMILYNRLVAFYKEHGHSNVPRAHSPDQPLAEYAAQAKQRARLGRLRESHIALLNRIEFPWVDGKQPIPHSRNS